MHIRYCTPEKDGNTYEGFHLKSLRIYDTEEEAEAVADSYPGMGVFHCEYGNCWHLKRIFYPKF